MPSASKQKPPARSEARTIWIDAETWKRLRLMGFEEGISASEIVRRFIESGLKGGVR